MRKQLTALLCAVLVTIGLLPAAGAIGPASPDILEGIDVSVYQGSIDFRAAAVGGIEVVYIRSGYGLAQDSYFQPHAEGARAAGIPFGCYHYVTARTPDQARREAAFFAATIAGTGYTCRPAMDFEALEGLYEDEASAIAVAFLTEVERLTGVAPIVYSDSYNASYRFDSSVARWPLWAAAYGPEEPDVTANWDAWVGFQYTDRGLVPGVSTYVDRDKFTRDVLLGETPPHGSTFPYTVVWGDTLWGLSRRYGTTVDTLVTLNHIANPNLIYVGQVLQIPGPRPGYFDYTVRPGDTLWGLSRRYGTTVEALVQLNGIANPDLIYVGQVLRIPG